MTDPVVSCGLGLFWSGDGVAHGCLCTGAGRVAPGDEVMVFISACHKRCNLARFGPLKEGSGRWWWGPGDRVPVYEGFMQSRAWAVGEVRGEPPFSRSDSARLVRRSDARPPAGCSE